jgi:hypothetical protein
MEIVQVADVDPWDQETLLLSLLQIKELNADLINL